TKMKALSLTMEIHIDEYAGPLYHRLPGWMVGWLYYFEKANVDVAVKACWDVNEQGKSWSDCWAGLNGLLSQDNSTPQPVYWAYKYYADMKNVRVQSTTTAPQTVALADRSDAEQKIRLLIGRFYPEESKTQVTIEIKNYPYKTTKIKAVTR